MNRKDNNTIDRNREIPDSMNYDRLRELGMEYIRHYSGKLWTDHNVHDPGITILEQLCYALTDLGYRTSFDMKDLLTPEGSPDFEMKDHFIPAQEILPSHPLTIEDYRKLLLEKFECINNVFIRRSDRTVNLIDHSSNRSQRVKGFYDVSLLLEKGADAKVMKETVRTYLNENRNLCEMFMNVQIMTPVHVGICADIEISSSADHKEIMKRVNDALSSYICPRIRKYTLEEMLQRGKSLDEIFQNKVVSSLFVDKDELAEYSIKRVLHVSDVVNLMMSIENIPSIRHIHFIVADSQRNLVGRSRRNDLELLNPATTYFDFQPLISSIVITRGNFTYPIPNENFRLPISFSSHHQSMDIMKQPQGHYREIDQYISFQNEFPSLYHLGKEGIREKETAERKAQRMQLKGYLLFFDRILSDYLAQLYGIKDLYSWKPVRPITYFNGKLDGDEIDGLSELFSDDRDVKNDFERKSRFLDQMISRFNDSFIDYFVDKFNFSSVKRIYNKSIFLNSYGFVSSNRSRAQLPNHRATALEARVLSKLGIDPISSGRELTPVYSQEENGMLVFKDNREDPFPATFGMHVIEHIELLPNSPSAQEMYLGEGEILYLKETSRSVQTVDDPYSLRITVVLPGWLQCSLDYQFRIFVENLIREEVPAHIMVKICWVDPYRMMKFENVLEHYRRYDVSYKNIYRNSLKNMISEMTALQNIYPHIRLYNNDTSISHDSAILDFSNVYGSSMTDRLWKFSTEE